MATQWMKAARAAGVVVVLTGLAACGSTSGSTTGAAGATKSSAASQDAVAGLDHGSTAAADPMAGMHAMDGMEATIGDGTKATENGFTLSVKSPPTSVGRQQIQLLVAGPDGMAVTDAKIEQTKKMHLIVVRSDLSGYQHVHPELAADGTWSVEADLTSPGRWHLIADVTPIAGAATPARVALGLDLAVPGTSAADTPLPAVAKAASADGYDVVLDGGLATASEQTLTFTISKGGSLATGITEYLGTGGHLVALQQGTLGYTHLHSGTAPGPELTFTARAPKAGRYRLFLQFATGATVHTAEFTVDVA